MEEISKKEYNLLDLKEKLNYYSVTSRKCVTEGCTEENIKIEDNSEEPPFAFIYAMEMTKNGPISKNLPIKHVCTTCMVKKQVVDQKFFKKKEEKKFSFSTTKMKGNRGSNYYKDFSKQSWKADPEAGKNATVMSEKDINRLNNL